VSSITVVYPACGTKGEAALLFCTIFIWIVYRFSLPCGNSSSEARLTFNGGTLTVQAKNENRLKNFTIGEMNVPLAEFVDGKVMQARPVAYTPMCTNSSRFLPRTFR
jgi:hypothetical protein